MAIPTSQTEPLQLLADARAVLDEGLEDALSLLQADRGNVQIVDPVNGCLRIAAQAGFSSEFLEYFAIVKDDGSACGRAAQQLAQTVIADVNTDPGFAPHREIAAASGFRAVQSTPLIDHTGRVLGVVSTHYPYPHRVPGRELQLARRFGELVGELMADRLSTSPHALAGDPLSRAVASVYECQPVLADASSIAKRSTQKRSYPGEFASATAREAR